MFALSGGRRAKKPTAQPGSRGRYGKKGRDFLPNAALKKSSQFLSVKKYGKALIW